MSFSKDFVWGAAAASYQIEGAWDEDGKGLSVWDTYTDRDLIYEKGNGKVACDHYHRYPEDVALMGEIGLRAYRLSVSWPRILPEGTGAVNRAGLDFYDRLIDALLAREIDPWVTLYHWDYPYDLFLRGGWMNPESPKWFADYAAVVVDRLSDRVKNWVTINEPQCFIGMGYLNCDAIHAPGLKQGMREALWAGHHSLMGHGLAVQVIRARAKLPPVIGWAPVGTVYYPATDSAADIEASRIGNAAVYPGNFWNNTWWADPILLGHYPEEGLQAYAKDLPKFKASDFDVMKQPLDFYGVNIYAGMPVKAGEEGKPEVQAWPQGFRHTHFLWKVTPEALYWGPKFLHERYGLPIVITENGMTNTDWVGLDGKVHDGARIDYVRRYLLQLRQAAADGVDIRGYFHWSIMDNFEWGEGYKHRFGLVHVDYETQKRTLKDSAYWYRTVIETNGESLLSA